MNDGKILIGSCPCQPAYFNIYKNTLKYFVNEVGKVIYTQLFCVFCFEHGILKDIAYEKKFECIFGFTCYQKRNLLHGAVTNICASCWHNLCGDRKKGYIRDNRFMRFLCLMNDPKFSAMKFSNEAISLLVRIETTPTPRNGGNIICANPRCGAREKECDLFVEHAHFYHCGICAEFGRIFGKVLRVYYCRPACQHEHYPEHSVVCLQRKKEAELIMSPIKIVPLIDEID